MKSKLKVMALSFVLMIVIDFLFSSNLFFELGIENPHVGLLFVLGLLFGPYGALGAVLANFVLDLLQGYTVIQLIPSVIFTFGVSYLAYKLWYSGQKADKITKPVLDNIYHLSMFLSSIVICGLIYSVVHAILIGIYVDPLIDEFYFVSYFLKFINIAFILGILSIWIFKKTDLMVTPKTSKRAFNKKLYRVLFYLLVIVAVISTITLILRVNQNLLIVEMILIGILLFCYLTKPFKYKIQPNDKNTIIEKIIRNFLIITVIFAILGVIISILTYNYVVNMNHVNLYLHLMPALIITDIVLILFFVPGMLILKYIENKVITPISSFSEIERFISPNEKIEADKLLDVYSKYVNENNEIGTLARSYTELINHNNNYIENIREIEGEKERINAELDIATRIQAASLPTEALENDEFFVDGYSHPAKEVGGDFFDYYMIDDDNLAMVIGDASGKGVPAAIVAMITQVTIKQTLKTNQNPSEVLYQLNNQLYENNAESMFLTLWLGIYNIKTKKLVFSNAGHNPPLLKENGKFRYLNIDSGIVLGVMEDFEYEMEDIDLTDELVLYTDGITDANNEDNKMYGQDRLLKFFNEFKSDENPIVPLLDDINDFTKDAKQYDDMTFLCLKIK